MKRLLLFTVLSVVLAAEVSSAFAQNNYPVSTDERPCSAEVGLAPGRPTLKRRAPATTPTDKVNQRLLDKEECKGEAPAADSLNDQKSTRFQFEGLHAFNEADMVKAFRERRIELPKTQMSSPEVRDKAVALIRELLESRGHFHATVDSRSDEGAGTLVFQVNEGQRLALAEVRFEGNRSFSSQELTSKMGEYLAHYSRVQDGYDSNIFEYCTRSLLNFIRNRGYLQATFGAPTKQIEGPGLVVIIPVNEGVLYRLGEIKIQGAEAVAQENVRAMLSLRQGDIASGDDIGKWLFEDLKRFYGELGHIEYTAEPEPEFKAANGANEGVVDFKVTIEEGRRFKVHGIRFQGSSLPDNKLLGLLRIHAGDIFNQRLLEESIKQLNQSGRFESIDKDRDIDFRTDEEEAVIDIVIKVNAKGGALEAPDPSLTRRQP